MSGLQFTPANVRLIQRGIKTQTRRRARGDERPRWTPGRTYAVQPGRGKRAVCRVRVTDVRLERLGAITYEDARAEGFRTRGEFAEAWLRLHDARWFLEPGHATTTVERSDREIAARFDRRWADRFVWVISFELDTAHVPRFLAAQSDLLYVSDPAQALPDEPEAVTEAEQARITDLAGREFAQFQAVECVTRDHDRARVSFAGRVAAVRRRARVHGVNVDRGLWMVERMIADGRPPGAILNKLQGVERMLDNRKAA